MFTCLWRWSSNKFFKYWEQLGTEALSISLEIWTVFKLCFSSFWKQRALQLQLLFLPIQLTISPDHAASDQTFIHIVSHSRNNKFTYLCKSYCIWGSLEETLPAGTGTCAAKIPETTDSDGWFPAEAVGSNHQTISRLETAAWSLSHQQLHSGTLLSHHTCLPSHHCRGKGKGQSIGHSKE